MLERGLLVALVAAFVLCLAVAAVSSRGAGVSLGRDRLAPEAEERAETLLRELLSEAEYRQLARDGYLEVPSPAYPGRTYRVPRGWGQVQVFEGGRPLMALCVQPAAPLPVGDLVLLHKLLIEGDEAAYLRVANRFAPGPASARRLLRAADR